MAIDNLVTGSVANIEELFGTPGFTFVEHDVSNYVWVPGNVDTVMHLASPASPVDFERIPIQILKVGGLGTHNCLGLALGEAGQVLPRLDLRGVRRPARASRSPRSTGATSTPSASAACTTRPSATPKR